MLTKAWLGLVEYGRKEFVEEFLGEGEYGQMVKVLHKAMRSRTRLPWISW